MRFIPLLVVPLLLYNAFAFLIFESYDADFREAVMFHIPLPSGATFTLTVSATVILLALVLLAFEVIKAARVGATSIVDHMLATVLFIIYLVEFLLVPEAATSTFAVLMGIALVDLACGFAVSLKAAARDVTFTDE
jgi:hypothetical protein